jgi:TRAP-type C4-dicarboxylate transport system substrate-binding protein
MWDGFWFIANRRAWRGLPPDIQKIVASAINDAGVAQRGDIKSSTKPCRPTCNRQGLAFNKTNPDSFRAKLRDGGFYKPNGRSASAPRPGACSKELSASSPE